MSIARNTIISFAGTAVTIAVTMVTVPLYIEVIGLERYGILAVVWTILAYFGMVELGVSGALVQRLARGGLSPQKRLVIYWTGFTMNAVMGMIGGLAILVSFDDIMSLMSFETAQVGVEARSAARPIAGLLLVMTLRSINNSVIFSAERFSAAALLLTAEMTASAIAPLLVALYFSPDIRSLTTAILVVRTAFLAASFVVAIPSLPGFKLALGSIRAARDLLSIGIWFWFAGLIGPLLTYFDRLMIGSVVGVAQLPYYSVPQTMLQQVSHVPRTLGAVLFPRYSAVEDDATADKLTVMAMEAMAFVVTPLIAFLILAMEPLLTVWLSEEFAVNSTLIGSIIMLSLLPSSMARIIASQLNGRGRPDLVVKILLLEAVPYGIALYLLAQSFGLLGVAVAWTLRATVDAFLLAARTNVFFRMFKQLQWPFALITTSIIVGLVWDLGDPRRWIASVVVLLVVSGWCVYRMPPALSRLIDKVPVIRWLPVGSLYKYHA